MSCDENLAEQHGDLVGAAIWAREERLIRDARMPSACLPHDDRGNLAIMRSFCQSSMVLRSAKPEARCLAASSLSQDRSIRWLMRPSSPTM
jgi:hypothetical protein